MYLYECGKCKKRVEVIGRAYVECCGCVASFIGEKVHVPQRRTKKKGANGKIKAPAVSFYQPELFASL